MSCRSGRWRQLLPGELLPIEVRSACPWLKSAVNVIMPPPWTEPPLATLPEHVDLLRYKEIQQEWNQCDCSDGVMSRLWRWIDL